MPVVTNAFDFECSTEVFSDEEIEILRLYGNQFRRLTAGDRAPATESQQRFIDVAKGLRPADTPYEKAWFKYLRRVEWENDSDNRAAMGEPRRMPDDRADWKKMRGAVWSDMKKRSKGLTK